MVSKRIWGEKPPEERVAELLSYCHMHLKDLNSFTWNGDRRIYQHNELYRIYYYDCAPSGKTVYNPLTKTNLAFSKTATYKWMNSFLSNLKMRRKVALRLGFLGDDTMYYMFSQETVKRLCRRDVTIDDLTENDLELFMRQKGVDMKIGIDIATLSYEKLVDQIALISGDSDFIPAAKLARVEGIDFILDPMGTKINENLAEHIDGLRSYWRKFNRAEDDLQFEA